jgi:hypothetical protein
MNESGKGLKLTAHLHLVLRAQTVELLPPLPHVSSWRIAYLIKHGENFTFFFTADEQGVKLILSLNGYVIGSACLSACFFFLKN